MKKETAKPFGHGVFPSGILRSDSFISSCLISLNRVMLFLRDKTRDVMSYVLNVNISLDLRFCEDIREVADHSGFQGFFLLFYVPISQTQRFNVVFGSVLDG